MSIGLILEVRKYAPVEITPAEYVVLLMIAEKSQEKAREDRGRWIAARECFPSREALARDCRLTEAALEKAMQRLARRGLEVRVPLGTDRRGRSFFARAGARTTYRLPELERRSDSGPGSSEAGAAQSGRDPEQGRREFRAEVGTQSGHARTTVRAEPGTQSGPKRNVTLREPEREPSDPSDRGQLPSTDPRDLDDVVDRDDVDRMVEVIDARLDFQMDGYEVSTARGMLQRDQSAQSIAAMVNKVVNKIEADRRRRGAA